MLFLGSGGVWGAILIVNIMKRIIREVRIIILLYFGLVTFRIHYWKSLKPLISWFSDLADVTMSPKTNMIYLWRPQDT